MEGGVDLGKGEYDQKMLYKFLRYYYINNSILVLYTFYVIQAMCKWVKWEWCFAWGGQ